MKKQYLLKVQFAMDKEENRWWIGTFLDPMARTGKRFYDSKREADAALNRIMKKFNQEHVYGPDGTRRETNQIGGGFAADMVLNKTLDDMNRIVAWSIQAREVTPWEEVDHGED